MDEPDEAPAAPTRATPPQDREARRAAALRANLKRRKTQASGRRAATSEAVETSPAAESPADPL
jgi:hypothetical protein